METLLRAADAYEVRDLNTLFGRSVRR